MAEICFVVDMKGQPGACSSGLRRVRGRVRPLWVYCTQPFPAFLQEAVSRTRTRDHDLMVTRQQLYRCAKAPLLVVDMRVKEKSCTSNDKLQSMNTDIYYPKQN
jgi:hypothetical protein